MKIFQFCMDTCIVAKETSLLFLDSETFYTFAVEREKLVQMQMYSN